MSMDDLFTMELEPELRKAFFEETKDRHCSDTIDLLF